MSNGDHFDEKMRRGDRSKEARRISPPLKLLLKSPKLRGSTAPKSAHLHRGREQGVLTKYHRISYSNVRLSFVNLRWAQLYVSLVESVEGGTSWYSVVLGQNRAVLFASMICFQKIYGLHGLNHQIIEYSKKEKVITDKRTDTQTHRQNFLL